MNNRDQFVRDLRVCSGISIALVLVLFCMNMSSQYPQTKLNIAYAGNVKSKFNEADFVIQNFGIGVDGNPFLTVKGKAGDTVPQEENLGFAYVFVTNDGTYAVTSDWMYPKWHAHVITLDDNNCVGSLDMKGGAEVTDKVKLTKTNAKIVEKVMTAQFSINDKDGSICADKIFDSAPS